MSQTGKDRYVFFFDCSEEADRDIDESLCNRFKYADDVARRCGSTDS